MIKKTIVILANSVKHGNHCVAGKCITSKSWARPVFDVSGGELQVWNRSFCKPLTCHGDTLAEYWNSWDDGK